MSISKIISGGQTGVDRAALDAALSLGIACGGWCPKGRRAEDSEIDSKYPLKETPEKDYSQRTEWNVRDSDGTLIITYGIPSGGTSLTLEIAKKINKPCMVIDLDHPPEFAVIHQWINTEKISVLNIAGPRKSQFKDIHEEACSFILELLK